MTEIPDEWQSALSRWRRLKRRAQSGGSATATHEYLLLQSLLAISGPPVTTRSTLRLSRARIEEYAIKSAREAKEVTSWLDPDTDYEETLRDYVRVLLPEGRTGFIRDFK